MASSKNLTIFIRYNIEKQPKKKMQFTCSAKELSFNLSIVNRVIQKRNTHPILSQVLVVAESEAITLTGFDLSLGTKLSFPAVVIGKGAFTVPSQLLLGIISKLENEPICREYHMRKEYRDSHYDKLLLL